MHTSHYSITEYTDKNCPLFRSMQQNSIFGITFHTLYNACRGNVCLECNYKTTGDCNGLAKSLNSPAKIIKYKKTNGELAKILNCSKRQIAKKRKNGTLPKEYS